MLMKYGLYSAIVDAYDQELLTITRGGMPEIVSLVHRVMDGDEPGPQEPDPQGAGIFQERQGSSGEDLVLPFVAGACKEVIV